MNSNDSRRPTNRGARKCLEWIKACQDIGWPKSTIPSLVDIWWEYHDDDGNLIESSAQGKTVTKGDEQ